MVTDSKGLISMLWDLRHKLNDPKTVTKTILTFFAVKCVAVLASIVYEKESDPEKKNGVKTILEFLQLLPAALGLYGFNEKIPWLILVYLIHHGIFLVILLLALILHAVFLILRNTKHFWTHSFWTAVDNPFVAPDTWSLWAEVFVYFCVLVFCYYNVILYYREMIRKKRASAKQKQSKKRASTKQTQSKKRASAKHLQSETPAISV